MRKWTWAVVLLLSSAALAEGIDGLGRISVGGGFRWVPNWWFADHAAALGTPVTQGLSGGPAADVSFGYGVNANFELSIDLLAGYESIALALPDGGRDEYTSAAYGAQLGGRLVGNNVFAKGLMPYLTAQAGPWVSNISSHLTPVPERLLLAFSVGGGLTYRFMERYGITLEAKYMNARSAVPGISGINVGGVWFSAMFTIFFPPAPKRDLDVPGF